MMKVLPRLLVPTLILVATLGVAPAVLAQVDVGKWVKDSSRSSPRMTMIVETCCGSKGRRITYRIPSGHTTMVLTVESPFDGTDTPVLLNGKPTSETMAFNRMDDLDTFTFVKRNGKLFGTAQSTLSPDRKTLTVEYDMEAPTTVQPVGKHTEVWIKQ
jgi:hypothetical protein